MLHQSIDKSSKLEQNNLWGQNDQLIVPVRFFFELLILIIDVENDPNVSITTAEYFPRSEVISKSDLRPVTSRRTDLYNHEKLKLFNDIDDAIAKSRKLVENLQNLPKTGTDLIEIEFEEDTRENHRQLTDASYNAMPFKISVRSTLPPKIRVNGQRPEITRKSLSGMKSNSLSFATERRQPDVSVSYRDERRPWKVAFHGEDLEYPKYLEKKHGKNGISMTILVEKQRLSMF